MIDSRGLVVIGQERALDGLAGAVVVPDGCGQGEDALQDADGHALGGMAAVLFQAGLAFEGVVDRLDDLAQWLEEPGACPFRLVLAGGPQELDPGAGHGGLEGGAEVVLVADEGLAGPRGGQAGAGGEHAGQDLALAGFRAGQGEGDGQALQGAHQVQAPEPAGMTGAVPVLRPSGQVRAPGGLPGAAAFDRGGIDHPDVIGPYAGIGGQDADAVPDQRRGGAQPLAVTGLLRQVREQVPQVSPGVPQPPGLGREPRQGLHDRQGDQLSVAQLHPDAHPGPVRRELRRFLQQVIGPDIQCGGKGVQVGVHEGLRVRRWVATPILDTLLCSPGRDTPYQTPSNWSSRRESPPVDVRYGVGGRTGDLWVQRARASDAWASTREAILENDASNAAYPGTSSGPTAPTCGTWTESGTSTSCWDTARSSSVTADRKSPLRCRHNRRRRCASRPCGVPGRWT